MNYGVKLIISTILIINLKLKKVEELSQLRFIKLKKLMVHLERNSKLLI